jgi:hypothetical protein
VGEVKQYFSVIPKPKQAKPLGGPKIRKAVLPPEINILPELVVPAPTTAAATSFNAECTNMKKTALEDMNQLGERGELQES